MTLDFLSIFQRDDNHEGVRRISIYLLRLVFILMFFCVETNHWFDVTSKLFRERLASS
jgi:hypothetical protein